MTDTQDETIADLLDTIQYHQGVKEAILTELRKLQSDLLAIVPIADTLPAGRNTKALVAYLKQAVEERAAAFELLKSLLNGVDTGAIQSDQDETFSTLCQRARNLLASHSSGPKGSAEANTAKVVGDFPTDKRRAPEDGGRRDDMETASFEHPPAGVNG